MKFIKNDEKCYVNYKYHIFWIKNYYRKLFLSNKLYLPGNEKSLGNSLRPLLAFLIVEVDLNIAQSEEKTFEKQHSS